MFDLQPDENGNLCLIPNGESYPAYIDRRVVEIRREMVRRFQDELCSMESNKGISNLLEAAGDDLPCASFIAYFKDGIGFKISITLDHSPEV